MSDWFIWGIFFTALMALDFVFMSGRDVTVRRSICMSLFYMAVSVSFTGYVALHKGGDAAAQYLTIYGLEQMLSIDNLLVISMIFAYFGIAKKNQHTALLFGIAGAVFFRVLFIGLGTWMLERVEWMLFGFALILIYSGYKIACGGAEEMNPADRKLVKFLKKWFGASGSFIAAIIAIELSDIMFAVDSIPASFTISRDPFVIITANLFAVMGLRSLYHAVSHGLALAAGVERYIGLVLVVLGLEVFVNHLVFEVSPFFTMGMVFAILGIGVWQSVRRQPFKSEI